MKEVDSPSYYLEVHEWLTVVILLGVLTGFSLVAYINSDPGEKAITGNTHHTTNPIIDITIDGAVENPGKYKIEKGKTLMEAIKLASPLPEAELDPVELSKPIQREKMISVPYKRFITIYLKGAVKNPGTRTLLKGTLLEELTDVVAFEDEADIEVLRKKRKLKDQEEIIVPYCE